MTRRSTHRILCDGVLAPVVALMQGRKPTVVPARASKNALAPQVRTEREKTPDICYLRDRDFDADPPDDTSCPVVDRFVSKTSRSPLGWRWCRHEIESYMLEPAVVAAALDPDDATRHGYIDVLRVGARTIRYYEAARWAVGKARRVLPPAHALRTRPDEAKKNKEFFLPDDLGRAPCRDWLTDHVGRFGERVLPALQAERLGRSFDEACTRFTDDRLEDPNFVLLWFSGKDLFRAVFGAQAGEKRTRIRDWMRDNPEAVLEALPEWRGLLGALGPADT